MGNRDEQNFVNLTNKRLWSYPGYNEIITGKADDERIKNNKDIPNPNVSVFEIAKAQSTNIAANEPTNPPTIKIIK